MDRNVWSARIWLLKLQGKLTPQDYLNAKAILKRANRKGSCWPSEARIAADAGCTDRTVRSTKAKLREHSLIDWIAERKRNGKQSVCVYSLRVPRLKPAEKFSRELPLGDSSKESRLPPPMSPGLWEALKLLGREVASRFGGNGDAAGLQPCPS